MLHGLHTRAAMPRRVIQLNMRLPCAQILGFDGIFEPVEVGGLRVGPLLAAMQPLEAVVVEVTAERDTRWESAVAEGGQGVETRDFINVAND